jgi:hypothetical protein
LSKVKSGGNVVARLRVDNAPPPVLLEGDVRVQALQTVRSEPIKADDYVHAINMLWSKAHAAFLDIGRLLIRAKELLPHGEYTAAVEGRLPFTARTAYQLREAARWAIEMDASRVIPMSRLPGSYSTIYLLSTLDPPTLEAAEAEGLVRPELRRSELVAWRKEKTRPKRSDLMELEVRRDKLRRDRDRLDQEIRQLEEQLKRAGGR